MQVKKFEAPTMQEALETIKRELGPEAVILQTKRNKGGFGLMGKGSIEVTAAVAEKAVSKKNLADSRLPSQTVEKVKGMSAQKQKAFYDDYLESKLDQLVEKTSDRINLSSKSKKSNTQPPTATATKITATRYADIDPNDIPAPVSTPHKNLEKEVEILKQIINEMRTSNRSIVETNTASQKIGSDLTPSIEEAFDFLILNGVDRRLAYETVQKAAFQLDANRKHDRDAILDEVTRELIENIEVMDALEGVLKRSERGDDAQPVVMALVGSSGVGKTSSLTKIASLAQTQKNLKVGLIDFKTPDAHRNVIFDELLETYSKILKVPYRKVISKEEIKMALAELSGMDMILIDTASLQLRSAEQITEIEESLHFIPNIRIQLVLSACTSNAENSELARTAKDIRPEGLIFTKLDEAVKFGTIYNISEKFKLPLLYFTTGQKFPDDIEMATPERVVAKIMGLA